MTGELAVRVVRGKAIEAEHYAAVAVIDRNGRLTHYLGDPDSVWMTRSSVKPFQALPLIVIGGADACGFDERQLAITCASHNGDDEHREVVQSNLKRLGLSEADLLCGTHWPIGMRQAQVYPTAGEDKDPLRHNCSGKHSGFLALAKFLGEPLTEYLNPNSKTQQLVKQSVADRCEYDIDKIEVGIDGCSAPVFSLPVRNLALGFMNLATGRALDSKVRAALNRVRAAMQQHPHLVAGEHRFDTAFMRALPGNGVSKVGAESIQGFGLAEQGIGVCVKILDGTGGSRALGPVCVEVLRQLGVINNVPDHPELVPYHETTVTNYRGIVTGRIAVDFVLRKA